MKHKETCKALANGVWHVMHIAYIDTYVNNNIIGRSVANFLAFIPSFNLCIIGKIIGAINSFSR
jgi:hypothetical protein